MAEARSLVGALSAKELDARKGSMRAFLAKNPDLEAKNSKGEAKQEILIKFQVWLMRAKKTEKKAITSHSQSTSNKLINTLNWWAEEQMDKMIGPILGAAYRESDSLPTRANKVTKKKDRYHLQYGVPTDIEEYTEEDLKKMKAQAEI